MCKGLQRLVKVCDRRSVSRARHSLVSSLVQVDSRLLPHFSLLVMDPEPLLLRCEIPGVERFDRLCDPMVEAPTAPRRKPGVRDFAHPVMGEVEALADSHEHPPPDELFYSLRGRVLVKARRALEELKLELPPNHRSHRQKRLARVAQ